MAQGRLKIDKLRRDGGTQIRVALDADVIDEYADAVRDGKNLPPAVVFLDPAGEHWLADGFHRAAGYELAGRKQMPVEIRDGELRDAILYALRANAEHGLRRTNRDKRNAVLTALADPEWAKLSDRKLSDLCAVSQPFVSKVRAEEVGARGEGRGASEDSSPTPNPEPPTPSESDNGYHSPEAAAHVESTVLLPITSEQVDELNDLFDMMGDDEIDLWMSPYGVTDWGDLNASQAAELIAMMRNRERLKDEGGGINEEPPVQPSEDQVALQFKGTSEDKWDVATVTLLGELAVLWQLAFDAAKAFESAEKILSQRVDHLCHRTAFAGTAADIFERKTTKAGEHWYCKPLRAALNQIKQYVPVAPCPHCLDKANPKCAVCDGRRFVSKEAWELGWVRPEEKLRMIQALGGSVK